MFLFLFFPRFSFFWSQLPPHSQHSHRGEGIEAKKEIRDALSENSAGDDDRVQLSEMRDRE